MNSESSEKVEDFEKNLTARVDSVIQRMKERPFIEGGDVALLEKRKAHVELLLKKVGAHAPQLLDSFDEIAKKHLGPGRSFKELALFVVGGNAYGGPFKEHSDVDLVFAAHPPLDPIAKDATITFPQRHAIGNELYDVINQIFSTEIADGSYTQGDIEIKGFGNQSPEELKAREGTDKDVVRLLSKIWPEQP